ncbi:MAG: DoxX family protein [Sphingobacteriales bacterium]
MKTVKITYWITTAIVALMMTFSGYAYLTAEKMEQAFQHLGFPDYFRIELAIAKFIGAALLLLPLSPRIKEWAYAGFTITFVSAFIAHSFSGDPAPVRFAPVIFLVLLAVSYITYHKQHKAV